MLVAVVVLAAGCGSIMPSTSQASPSMTGAGAPSPSPSSSAPVPTPTPVPMPSATVGRTQPAPFGPTTAATPGPTSAPTHRPTAAPTPRPTVPPTPRPTVAPASVLVEHGDRSRREVALTFDMGGRVEPALPIMEWLIAHDVHATIFMTGAMADSTTTDAGREVLRLVDEHAAQFDLGNHSYHHEDFRTIDGNRIREELATTEQSVEPYCRQALRPLFRPPYGSYDSRVLAAVGAAGYARTVRWDVDTIDWKPEADGGPTAARIVSGVLGNARGGSIVLMHLGGYNTLAALPGIVGGLRSEGYALVTLHEMLGA